MKKGILFIMITAATLSGVAVCKAQALPTPYATTPTKRSSKVIGWPEGKTPVGPAGFRITDQP